MQTLSYFHLLSLIFSYFLLLCTSFSYFVQLFILSPTFSYFLLLSLIFSYFLLLYLTFYNFLIFSLSFYNLLILPLHVIIFSLMFSYFLQYLTKMSQCGAKGFANLCTNNKLVKMIRLSPNCNVVLFGVRRLIKLCLYPDILKRRYPKLVTHSIFLFLAFCCIIVISKSVKLPFRIVFFLSSFITGFAMVQQF